MDKQIYFSDAELLQLLEENNYKPSFKNLMILKEGLESGKIMLEDKKEEKEVVEEPVEEEAPVEEAPVEPAVSVNMSADGSMEVKNNGKIVVTDGKGNVSISLAERLNPAKTERLLKSFLTEDCGMLAEEFDMLTEETKVESVKEIAIRILQNVEDKISNIDTSTADRSRGDIKQLRELQTIQDVITQLEAVLERDDNALPEYSDAVNTIIKSILYINQFSQVFKDAYRNKKTVMILKYESLILSIISSISYLLATIIDYNSGDIRVKKTAQDISGFAPLQSLKAFVNSVNSGEFKTVTRDATIVREYYLEIPVETMSTILEANDYIPMIVDGVKNIYTTLVGENGGKLTNLLYKAAGYIVLLFSLRETFYTLFKMKTKVSDMVGQIQNFAGLNNGGNILNKLTHFASKFKTDAEFGSDISKREIEDENKKMLSQVRSLQAGAAMKRASDDEDVVSSVSGISSQEVIPGDDTFGFDF